MGTHVWLLLVAFVITIHTSALVSLGAFRADDACSAFECHVVAAWVQRYWAQILQWIDEGKVDGTWLITHHMPFTEAAKAYGMFDQHQDGAVKIMLQPHLQK